MLITTGVPFLHLAYLIQSADSWHGYDSVFQLGQFSADFFHTQRETISLTGSLLQAVMYLWRCKSTTVTVCVILANSIYYNNRT